MSPKERPRSNILPKAGKSKRTPSWSAANQKITAVGHFEGASIAVGLLLFMWVTLHSVAEIRTRIELGSLEQK
jgi:hypothetical protein